MSAPIDHAGEPIVVVDQEMPEVEIAVDDRRRFRARQIDRGVEQTVDARGSAPQPLAFELGNLFLGLRHADGHVGAAHRIVGQLVVHGHAVQRLHNSASGRPRPVRAEWSRPRGSRP